MWFFFCDRDVVWFPRIWGDGRQVWSTSDPDRRHIVSPLLRCVDNIFTYFRVDSLSQILLWLLHWRCPASLHPAGRIHAIKVPRKGSHDVRWPWTVQVFGKVLFYLLSICRLAFCWALGGVLLALTAWVIMPLFGWRALVGLSALPLAVFLFTSPWCPESPLYLATTGKETEVYTQINRVSIILLIVLIW